MKFLKKFFVKQPKVQKDDSFSVPVKVELEDVENFIYNWNLKYPIDRWFRKKYNIAFNSPEHRSISFIDMFIDFKEDVIYERAKKELKESKYEKGDYLKERDNEIKQLSNEDWLKALMNSEDGGQ